MSCQRPGRRRSMWLNGAPGRVNWTRQLVEATDLRGGHSKLKPRAAQKSKVMAEDSGQTFCRMTRPGEDQSLLTLPSMVNLIRWLSVPILPPGIPSTHVLHYKGKEQKSQSSDHPCPRADFDDFLYAHALNWRIQKRSVPSFQASSLCGLRSVGFPLYDKIR